MILKRLLLLIAFVVTCLAVHAQTGLLNAPLDGSEEGKTVTEFLNDYGRQHQVRFFFLNEWFDQLKVEKSYKGQALGDALQSILQGSDVTFVEWAGYSVIFSKDPTRALERANIIRTARNEQKKVDLVTIGNKANYQPGKTVVISGTVREDVQKVLMIGADVIVQDLNQGTHTGPDGKYSISIPSGEHIITVHQQNFEEKIINIKVYESGTLDVALAEAPKMLTEIEVNADHLNVTTSRIGQTNIKMADIKKMPSFLGEVDIIKSIQVLPGVTSVGEVSSGFNVRGGGVDQNLILYDGTPVFNNAHVFGFFSSFNAEAIKDATFYKGGIPAEYGGRVSSVLSMTSKEGNYKKWEASGGIGIVAANLAVNGPIVKDKTSILISARTSYSDWLLKLIPSKYSTVRDASVSFYDLSAKIAHKFNDRNKLQYSGYLSRDHFGLPSDTTFVWTNSLHSLRFDHIYGERAFSSFTAGFGQYGYEVTDSQPETAYLMTYKISYPSLKFDYNYQYGRHKIVAGINTMFYEIQPGRIHPTSPESSKTAVTVPNNHSLESALYIGEDFEASEKIHIEAGFRLSSFQSLGQATVFRYQAGEPMTAGSVSDSTTYGKNKVIKNYIGPEPRLSFRYTLTPNSSIKIGYNRIYQYIHLISTSAAVAPVDIWQPSNSYFKPQLGDQVSAGYFRNFADNKFEFSLEGFYKKLQNVLDFKDGSTVILNPKLETALLQGVGKAYGVEVAVTKTAGRLLGTMNYTYSRSLRKVTSEFPDESINEGQWYRSNYDQPHIVNVNWKYGISRRFSFTGNFTYRTGRPVTVPTSYATVDNLPIVNYSGRNGLRVSDYHRLDLAIVMEGNHRRKKFWDGTWTFSIYNVYARKNVYSVFYQNIGYGIQAPYQMSIIGTALPSLSYKFKI